MKILDHNRNEVSVSIENGRISFSPPFFVCCGIISYIEAKFNMHYAPDVAENIDAVFFSFPQEKRHILLDMLAEAKKTVLAWDIRDAVDARDQKRVLDVCANRGV